MGPHESSTIRLVIAGPLERADLPGLLVRLSALLEHSSAKVAICELTNVQADAIAVDAIARLQLAARRRGFQVRVGNAPAELRVLLEFIGLQGVLLG